MARKRKLEIEITDSRKGDGFKKAERDVDSFGRKITSGSQSWARALGKFVKVAAVGLGIAAVAAAKFGMDAVKAFEESQQIGRQTDAVIKSMGASSWITADAVSALAEKLSIKAGIDDELIQSGQNVLLTFANVRNEVGKGNDVFDRATAVALDMSVALGQDMQQSVIQVGKALNDPIQGIGALRRVGVQLTEQQQESIKTFMEQGDLMSAQKVILGELSNQFGGSAEAQATASGKMQVAWGNLQEAIGEKLLPVFQVVSAWIVNTLIPAIEDLSVWIERELVPRLEDFGGWLNEHVVPAVIKLATWLRDTLIPALVAFAGWMVEHERVLTAVAIGITATLVPAFVAWAIAAGAAAISTLAAIAPLILIGAAVAVLAYLIITHWDTIKNATVTAFNAVKGAIETAFNWVKRNWPLLLAILTGPIGLAVLAIVRHWGTIKSGFTAVKNWIKNRVTEIVSFITGIPGRIGSMGTKIKNKFTAGIATLKTWIKGRIDDIVGFITNIPARIGDVGSAIKNKITSGLGGVASAVKGVLGFDAGGVVPGPRGSPQLILAHGGETVVPTHDPLAMAEMARQTPRGIVETGAGGGRGDVYYVTEVHVAGSVLSERELVEVINRQAAGGNPPNIRGRLL